MELLKDIRRYVLAHAGNLQVRFQHGPFTKRFKPVVTRVPVVVLSMSRFSRLAVTRAWLFALSDRGDGDWQSLWPTSSKNVLVNLLLLHCGHGLWDWTFPHGSRKQQTNVCTDEHNETILVVRSCSGFPYHPAGHSHTLKIRTCVYTPRRLQWIVIDCQRNLQQRQRILYKKNVGAHLASPPAH